ncbi:hypothetical protein DRO24_04905 [Candidatus Bathyarchaeota archaeon]|nr:MAG: hypothetical protein DRO24_04905 [Candidatus Bathyarchaeota archaeon]
MDERELAELLRRRGYKLRRVVRYRTKDAVVAEIPRSEGGRITVVLYLRGKLEQIPRRVFDDLFPPRVGTLDEFMGGGDG